MSEQTDQRGERLIRSDQWQQGRTGRTARSDSGQRRGLAGDYDVDPSAVGGARSKSFLTDERLRELIRERLTEDPDIEAGGVTVEVHEGAVTLLGSVDSKRTRDVLELCLQNCGATSVLDRLLIR